MHSYEAYRESDLARGDVEGTNKAISERLKGNNGKVDMATTRLYEKRLMQGLWLQYR